MKLLTVSTYFASHTGGLEIVAGRLAEQFARTGIDVTWLATDASPQPTWTDARLRAIPLAASNFAERSIGIPYPIVSTAAIRRIFREVAAADVVLVHDGLYLTSVVAAIAARSSAKPLVVVQHIGAVPYKNPILRWTMKIANRLVAGTVLGCADQVVFISETTVRYFAWLGFRSKPALIFNGVDTTVFSPPRSPAEVAAARRELGLPLAGYVVLFVGRFVEKKGLAILERVVRERPDLAFAFAGWGPMDPRAWNVRNAHVFDGLSGPGLAELYRACDVFVLPSVGEGFPLVVQEALACGLPVICGAETASADAGAADVLTAIPIDPNDPDGTAGLLRRALDGCLRKSGNVEARLARAALAAERYSWVRTTARYAEILTALHGRRMKALATRSRRTATLHTGG